MALQVQTLRSSGEDVDLLIQGCVLGAHDQILYDPTEFGGGHATVRVMSMVFAIETGLKVFLTWETSADEHDQFIIPLEGRGTLDFTKFGGLMNPRVGGWTGRVRLLAQGDNAPRYMTIALDLSKQRN